MTAAPSTEGAVRRAYLDALHAAFAGMLDRLDDALFDLAERSGSEELRASYFDVMRGIRLTREALQRGFLGIVEAVWSGAQPPVAATVEQAENMAFSVAVRYAESECAEELLALGRRLLPRVANPAGVQRALAPRVLFGAFEHVCEGLQAAMPVRLVLLKFFERHVGAELRTIYRKLLAQADGGTALALHPGGAHDPLPAAPDEPEGTGDLGAVLHRLAQGERAGAVEVLKLLATQHSDASGALRRTASLDLARIGNGDGPPAASAMDLAVDMLALLYDGSYADPGISAFVKVQLARLQLPLLKVAMRDGAFLSRRSHPARRFFSALLALGRARGHTLRPAEEARLSELIEQVADRCVEDPALFETGLAVLGTLAPPAAGAGAEGGWDIARLERAEAHARAALDALCAGRTLHGTVEHFLQTHWLRHLADVYLRHGPDSPAWRRGLGTAEALVWAVTAPDTADSRARIAEMRTRLLRQLRAGLDELAVPAAQQEAFYHELGELLDQALYVEPPAQEVTLADIAAQAGACGVLTATNSAGEEIALGEDAGPEDAPADERPDVLAPAHGASGSGESPPFDAGLAAPDPVPPRPTADPLQELLRQRGLDADTLVIEEIVLEGSIGRERDRERGFGGERGSSPSEG